MRRLEGVSELLDGPIEAHELRGNLRDLARVNRLLGGVDVSWFALANVLRATPPPAQVRVLDVGTGAADIPIELAERARRIGRRLAIVATDIRPEIVAVASANAADVAEVTVQLADAGRLDEPDSSFDVVHSSLLLHHLEPTAARALLEEMARVTRSVVIVNDLERGWSWWLGAWLLSHLMTGNRYSRNDAALSVRRAYTADELSALAAGVGLREVGRRHSRPPYRYALTFVRRNGEHA